MSKPRQKSAAEVRRETIERAQSEGLAVAYETALGICRDPQAPAPAKATALTALFRIGNGFEKRGDSDSKEAWEMTAEELAEAIERRERALAEKLERLERSRAGDPLDDDDDDDDETDKGGPFD